MIDVVRVEAVKDYRTWETELQVYCKIPMDTLHRLRKVDTDVLAGELGRELLEQLVSHMLRIKFDPYDLKRQL